MQHIIVGYVNRLHAITDATGGSIGQALQQMLPDYSDAALGKLREAAEDLLRLVDLERGRRVEALTEQCQGCWRERQDMPHDTAPFVDGLCGACREAAAEMAADTDAAELQQLMDATRRRLGVR